jgi:hypothetical protein
MDMLRIWPIVCEFGIGAILCIVGIGCGLRGGYLDLKVAEDRRFLVTLVAGFFLLLALVSLFTFFAPNWANGASL